MTSGFDLDLQTVEKEIQPDDGGEPGESDRRIVLGVLDGTSREREWFEVIERGDLLVLAIDGELNELAADLAPRVKERGGALVHFREFLIVTPEGVTIDADRL